MADLNRLRDLRRVVQNGAIARWQQRTAARAANASAMVLNGANAADSPARTARFETRESMLKTAQVLQQHHQLPVFIERKIGPTLDFMAGAPSEAARKAGRPVGRIVTSVDPHVEADGYATGFLVAPQLLLTNWHVFPDRSSAVGAGVNFLHESSDHGIQIGTTFAIDPNQFYIADDVLDFALVYVSARSVDGAMQVQDLGALTLIEATSKILVGQPINIIEYPDGGAKEYATTNNRLLDVLDSGFLHYETDTLEGSSGSPDFSEAWELVGLHHASIPEVKDGHIITVDGGIWDEGMGDDKVHWVANEGIRVSFIVQSLAKKTLADPVQARLLTNLLASTRDPVDDLAQHLAGVAPEALHPAVQAALPINSTPPSNQRANMAHNQFVFSGAVSIHVYAPGIAPPITVAPPPEAIEKSVRFDPNYDDREGFNEDFLDLERHTLAVVKPKVSAGREAEMLKDAHGDILELPYHHFTLAMNAKRRLQMWSAVNVDYDPKRRGTAGRATFGTDKWVADPRIPAQNQILNAEIYGPAHQIDCGHVVRREDNAWGDSATEVEFANSDTFHWTNCTPQHQAFNRQSPGKAYDGIKGLWGDFEVYIQKSLQQDDTKACILAGPVLAHDDPTADFGQGVVQYPVTFWKVVVVSAPSGQKDRELKVFGFVLSQKDVVDRFGIEVFEPGQFKRYQKSLTEIEKLTGLVFDDALHAAATLAK